MPQDRKAGTGLALIEGFVRQIGGMAAWEVAGGTRPWCTDRRDGRTDPDPRPGSREADGLRAAELQHPAQGTSGDGHPRRPTAARARPERVTDHPLVAADGSLGQGATVVAGRLLPAQAA